MLVPQDYKRGSRRPSAAASSIFSRPAWAGDLDAYPPHLLPDAAPPVKHQPERGIRPKKKEYFVAFVMRQEIRPCPSPDAGTLREASCEALRVDPEIDVLMESRGGRQPSRLCTFLHAVPNDRSGVWLHHQLTFLFRIVFPKYGVGWHAATPTLVDVECSPSTRTVDVHVIQAAFRYVSHLHDRQ